MSGNEWLRVTKLSESPVQVLVYAQRKRFDIVPAGLDNVKWLHVQRIIEDLGERTYPGVYGYQELEAVSTILDLFSISPAEEDLKVKILDQHIYAVSHDAAWWVEADYGLQDWVILQKAGGEAFVSAPKAIFHDGMLVAAGNADVVTMATQKPAVTIGEITLSTGSTLESVYDLLDIAAVPVGRYRSCLDAGGHVAVALGGRWYVLPIEQIINLQAPQVATQRKQLDTECLKNAVTHINSHMWQRLEQKGMGCFTSSHEILGVITEEYEEYIETVHDNAPDHVKIAELTDIATACAIGIASIKSGGTDW